LAYLSLEWIDDRAEQMRMTQELVAGQPTFAPV
jgi:hypothetical protein